MHCLKSANSVIQWPLDKLLPSLKQKGFEFPWLLGLMFLKNECQATGPCWGSSIRRPWQHGEDLKPCRCCPTNKARERESHVSTCIFIKCTHEYGALNMVICSKLKLWRNKWFQLLEIVVICHMLSWYFSQDTSAEYLPTSSGLSGTALHRFPWHELSSNRPVPPLQQQLKRELVNEKLRGNGTTCTNNGKGLQVTSCSPNKTTVHEYKHEIYVLVEI